MATAAAAAAAADKRLLPVHVKILSLGSISTGSICCGFELYSATRRACAAAFSVVERNVNRSVFSLPGVRVTSCMYCAV